MPNYRTPSKRASKPMQKNADGGKTNQYGVTFSKDEMSHMLSLVNKAAIKRKIMIEQEGALDWLSGGKPTGQKVAQLQLMGRESDVVLAKRSKSFQRFTSRKEFEMYMANLEDVVKPGYIERRVGEYKERYIKSLITVYGETAAKDVIKKVEKMSIQNYMKNVQQNDEAEIRFVYSKVAGNMPPSLNKIRLALGMKPRFDPEDVDDDEETEY